MQKIALLALGILSLYSCSKWTEDKALQVELPSIQKQNPELYASYLTNLKAYKASKHRQIFLGLDNSVARPSSRGQHLSSCPDSTDYIVLSSPEAITELQEEEIRQIKEEKGIKTLVTLDFNSIKDAFDKAESQRLDKEAADLAAGTITERATPPDFVPYLQEQTGKFFATVEGKPLSGIILSFVGQNINYMTEQEATTYRATQEALVSLIKTWRDKHPQMELILAGTPQYLLSADLVELSIYTILPTEQLKGHSTIEYSLLSALVYGLTQDKLIVSVNLKSLDTSDTKTGYWSNGGDALEELSTWLSGKGSSVGGVYILNAQNDYYRRSYSNISTAISRINP